MSLVLRITNCLNTLSFVYHTMINEGFYNPFRIIQGEKSRPIYILANGPSLNSFLYQYNNSQNGYANVDFFALNDFCNNSYFELIKPIYYVLSDPLFFLETIYQDRGKQALNNIVRKVNWRMYLFVPYTFRNSTFLSEIKSNANIIILPFHSYRFDGGEKMRFFLYRHNLGNGQFGTVALNALYISLQCGYKTIYIYGIDHNFFEDIIVDRDNILCKKHKHFYGEDSEYSPIINHYGGIGCKAVPFSVSEYLTEKASIFKGHSILSQYAKSIGAKIINCTPNSWVDAYDRLVIKANEHD